jgi:hypothetical protein
MSEGLLVFEDASGRRAVLLPFRLDQRIGEWEGLRTAMIRSCPEPFSREEWAYLAAFLDAANLRAPLSGAFGLPASQQGGACAAAYRPRGPVAVWLPSNVSLLGPLVLVLLSLSGNPLRLKAGSQAADLTAVFLEFARQHLPAGQLSEYIGRQVRLEQFGRDDPRNAAMAAEAAVRIVFGSDDAVQAVEALPHPVGSMLLAFSDHRSVAWIECAVAGDEALVSLIRVFTIYGQAGCTSPSQVVLLDGRPEDALRTRDRLLDLWPRVVRHDPPAYLASENVMGRQHAAALGWQAVLAPRNAAVLAAGAFDLPPPVGRLTLPIIPATLAAAVENLPANLQTIGHVLEHPEDPAWLRLLAGTRAKRFVPLSAMHHFGPVWDGWEFWKQLFEVVPLC